MTYADNCTCEICGVKCSVAAARLEWVKERKSPYLPIEMYLCHKECARGYNDPRAFVGEIDLDSIVYTEEILSERLDEMKKEWPHIKDKINYIQNIIYKA